MLSGYRRLGPGLGAVEGGVSLTPTWPWGQKAPVPHQAWVLGWSPKVWTTWVTQRMTESEVPLGCPASTGPRRQVGGETGGPRQVYAVQSLAPANVDVSLCEPSRVEGEGLLSASGPREAPCELALNREQTGGLQGSGQHTPQQGGARSHPASWGPGCVETLPKGWGGSEPGDWPSVVVTARSLMV